MAEMTLARTVSLAQSRKRPRYRPRLCACDLDDAMVGFGYA